MINKKESDIIEYLRGKDITIVGKKEEKYIGEMCEGFNCNFRYYDTELTRDIICIECEGKRFEVTLETSYGECCSGWTTASTGHIHIKEVECFGKLTHRSKLTKPIHVANDFILWEEYIRCTDKELYSLPNEFYTDDDNSVFSCSHNGFDEYYPMGGYYINSDFFEEIKFGKDTQIEEASKEELTNELTEEQLDDLPSNLTLQGLRSRISELTEQVEINLKALKKLQAFANRIGMKADY
jgi:hypothetical protein